MQTKRVLFPQGSYILQMDMYLNTNVRLFECPRAQIYSRVLDEETARKACAILDALIERDGIFDDHFNTQNLPEDDLDFLRCKVTEKVNLNHISSYCLLYATGNVEEVKF